MPPLRTFENKPGVTYNAAKYSTVFAEDMNAITYALQLLAPYLDFGAPSKIRNFVRSSFSSVLDYLPEGSYAVYPFPDSYEYFDFNANTLYAVPFFCSQSFSFSDFGLNLNSVGGEGDIQFAVYNSGDGFLPYDMLDSSSLITLPTAGFVGYSSTFQFEAGNIYWLAFRSSVTVTASTLPLAHSLVLGLAGLAADYSYNILAVDSLLTDPIPDLVPFSLSNLLAAVKTPAFRFKIPASGGGGI